MNSLQYQDKELIQNISWSINDQNLRAGTTPIQQRKAIKKQHNIAKDSDFFSISKNIQINEFQTQQQFNPKQLNTNFDQQKIFKNDSCKKLKTCQISQNIIKNKFNYEKIGTNLFNVSQKSEQNIKSQNDKTLNNTQTEQDDKKQQNNLKSIIKPLDNIVYTQVTANLNRPISTLGGQRKIIKFKINDQDKLPKLKQQNNVENFFQTLKSNQYKNVKQLKNINQNLYQNAHTKSNPQMIVQNQLKINNYDQKIIDIDDQFQDLLIQPTIDLSQFDECGKVTINSKRDLTRDNTLATNQLQSNLDQSFLNLFA